MGLQSRVNPIKTGTDKKIFLGYDTEVQWEQMSVEGDRYYPSQRYSRPQLIWASRRLHLTQVDLSYAETNYFLTVAHSG